jgi:hypothetical protein
MKIQQISQRARNLALAAVVGAAVVGGAALAPSVIAQGQQQQQGPRGDRKDPQQRIDQRIAMLTEKLQLNAAQQQKIRTILTDERTQMEALRKNDGGRRDEGRAGAPQAPNGARPDSARAGQGRGRRGGPPPEFLALRDRTEKQIEGVLNAQQLTTYRQLREQQKQDRERHEGAPRGEGHAS